MAPSEDNGAPSSSLLRVLGDERPSAERHLEESTNGGRTTAEEFEEDGQVLGQLLGTTPLGWREYIEPRFDYGVAIPPGWNPIEGRAEIMAFYNAHRSAFVSVEPAEKPSTLLELPEWSYDEDRYDDYERIKLE